MMFGGGECGSWASALVITRAPRARPVALVLVAAALLPAPFRA
jgi:hypothetical protein